MDLEAFDHPETTSARFCWRWLCSRGGTGNVLGVEIGGKAQKVFWRREKGGNKNLRSSG